MNCLICGVDLSIEPLNVDEEYGAHTACIEGLQEDNPEWREAMEKMKRLIGNKLENQT
jgi:hypothetical protein